VEATNESLLLDTALVLAISNRAENLCYQSGHGQNLSPQFRQIICLVSACFARKRKKLDDVAVEATDFPYVIQRSNIVAT